MNIKKIIREEIGEFQWIEDTNPYEEINLKDKEHVNTIKVNDRLIITGEDGDMVFNNAEGNVISIGTFRGKSDAWINQVLISFDEPLYSPPTVYGDYTITHCGQGGIFKQECNCKEDMTKGEGETGRAFRSVFGTCWWVTLPTLEKVVKINVGT